MYILSRLFLSCILFVALIGSVVKSDSTFVHKLLAPATKIPQKIEDSLVLVLDVDATLLNNRQPLDDEAAVNAPYLVRLLKKGVQVRLVSGNSTISQLDRIIRPLISQIGSDAPALKNLIIYCNGGTTRLVFKDTNFVSDPTYVPSVNFNQVDFHQFTHAVEAKVREIFESHDMEEELASFTGFGLVKIGLTQEGAPYEDVQIGTQEQYKLGQVVEIRDENSVTVKVWPKSLKLKGEKDVRDELIQWLKTVLPPAEFRPGGNRSIDIVPLGINKKYAIERILADEGLVATRLLYFGDEMAEGMNDLPVLEVEGVNAFFVGSDKFKLPERYIGKIVDLSKIFDVKGPLAVSRVLDLIDKAIENETTTIEPAAVHLNEAFLQGRVPFFLDSPRTRVIDVSI